MKWLTNLQRMPQNRIPLKSYHYRPQRSRTIGRPKKRCREQLQIWRRNGSKGPILDVYDDDDDNNNNNNNNNKADFNDETGYISQSNY